MAIATFSKLLIGSQLSTSNSLTFIAYIFQHFCVYALVMCDIRDLNIYRDINGHDMI